MSWLLSAFAWVLGRLLGSPSAPTSGEVEAKEAGAAEAVESESVQKARIAVAEADAAINAPSDKTGIVAKLDEGKF